MYLATRVFLCTFFLTLSTNVIAIDSTPTPPVVKKKKPLFDKFVDSVSDLGKSATKTTKAAAKKTTTAKKEGTPAEEESTMDKMKNTTVDLGKKVYEVGKKTHKTMGESRTNRENKNHSLMVSYGLINTWLPSKYGASYTYISSPEYSWELSWEHSSVSLDLLIDDLGKVSEDRLSLMRKSYSKRNSFYLTYGINYYNFRANIGNKLLSKLTGTRPLHANLVQVTSLGLSLGLGNRWQFKNWAIGIDWITLHVPVIILKSEAPYLDASTSDPISTNEVRDAFDIIKHIPTATALKLQIGYSF